jgi:alcohol dehydrogenase class IV
MKMHQFSYGPKLRIGAGSSAQIGGLLPPGRCLFVTDARVRELGLPDAALASLADAGIEPLLFDAVEPDPSRATLLAAVAAGQGCSSVVGFGGGSPLDVAKLAAYLLGSGDALDSLWGVGHATGPRLPLVAVPTTAGTGSEATPVTVITVEGAEKRGVSSAALVPDWAVLDAALTIGLPRDVTAATGIDAMVHAIEAYTSARLKNPMSDLLAREALRLCRAICCASASSRTTWLRARRCCLARISPGSPLPMRRWRACMRWPIRSAATSTCRTDCRTR